ncbi:MAG: hypothetical protein M3423_02915, partial [Actinomycetota bacterium]|nr:hypothetical protein [Actinomycetota bacterium]
LAGVQAMAATIEARARADADALERAWGRIADLERDNAALRSRLDAGEAPTGDGDALRDAEGRGYRPLTLAGAALRPSTDLLAPSPPAGRVREAPSRSCDGRVSPSGLAPSAPARGVAPRGPG